MSLVQIRLPLPARNKRRNRDVTPFVSLNGPLVKRSRHRPFTAVTWVQFPYGSPSKAMSIRMLPFLFCPGLLSDDQKPEKTGKPHPEHESETADLMYLKRSAGVARFRGAFGSCFADWFGINGLPVTR